MKVSTLALKRAAAKRKAREGPSVGEQHPTQRRQVVQASGLVMPAPPTAPEVDLTADTPPEAATIEGETVMEPTAEGRSAMEEHLPPNIPTSEMPRCWGEGPSGATVPPLEQVSVQNTTQAETEVAEDVGGCGARPGPSRDSILNDGEWAERLISTIIVPEVQEELSHLKAAAFFRESYAALVKVANSMSAAREAIRGGKSLMREAQREAEEARARAVAAEGALEAARAETRAAEGRAETESNRLRVALNQLGQVESAVEARNLQIAELGSALRAAENRATKAQEESEQSREAERSAMALLSAEKEARAVEVESAIEARVAMAIEEYKSSTSFETEVAEASAEAYLQGFQSGKEKVARDLDFPQALEVEPDRLSEIASDDEAAPADP